MHFQTDDLVTMPISAILLRIQRTLGLGSLQMSALLDMGQAEYKKLMQEPKEVPARSLMQLCLQLNIAFDLLVKDEFCYRTMTRQFFGNKISIPEKYTVSGRSKMTVLSSLLDFVKETTDWHHRVELMRYLQVNEAALDDPNATVNLRCTIEAVEWLHNHYRNDEVLEDLGRNMLFHSQHAVWTQELKKCRSIYELFDAICSESGALYQKVEKNFLWKIHKVEPGKRIVARGYVNEEILEQIGKLHIQSQPGFLVRKSMFSHMPCFIGLDSAPVKITQAFREGENCCEMELDTSLILRLNRKKALHLVN